MAKKKAFWLLILIPLCGLFPAINLFRQYNALFNPPKVSNPKRAYTAKFKKITPNNSVLTITISSNGKGQMLQDQAEEDIRYLESDATQQQFILRKKQKVAEQFSLQFAGCSPEDEELFLASPFAAGGMMTKLGIKSIDGHECRGYRVDTHVLPPSIRDSWFDSTTKILVQSNSIGNVRDQSSESLLEYKRQSMPQIEFEVPKDYKVIDYNKVFNR